MDNDIHTKLVQAHNRHVAEVKQTLNGLDDRIREIVQEELRVHLDLMGQAVQRIEAKLREHFG
jgi:hypothetical protein